MDKIGKFNSLNWKFPNFNSKEEKTEWLKAIFDCEAYVSIKHRKYINFQSVSKTGIYSIQKLLKEFEIESSIYTYKRKNPKWNLNYLLFIRKKENLNKFNKSIGFNHLKKQERLNQICQRAGAV